MKVLVTGASGLLGKELVLELLSKGYEVIAVSNSREVKVSHNKLRKFKIDISDTIRIENLILKERPEVIIHAAAYTDVDGCEVNKNLAWSVNVEGTRNIIRAARVVKAHIIYVSTDYVFDGVKGMYEEDDVPNPINYYGLTKLVAEVLVRSSDLLYTVVRPSAIYGVKGSKKSFAEFIAERLSRGEEVKALVDQYVSPTLNVLLAKAITEITELRPMGILHIAGERMSRYEFATKVAEVLNLPKELIKEARMEDMRSWIAKRPRDSSLNISKAKSLLRTRFYDTKEALKIFASKWLGGD